MQAEEAQAFERVVLIGLYAREQNQAAADSEMFLDQGLQMDEVKRSLIAKRYIAFEGEVPRLTDAGRNFIREEAENFLMLKRLSAFEAGTPAFKLELTFAFDQLVCKRTMLVPAHLTFEEFHVLMQALFNWMNYHLYEFELVSAGACWSSRSRRGRSPGTWPIPSSLRPRGWWGRRSYGGSP